MQRAFLLIIWICVTLFSNAQIGSLDNFFGGAGYVLTNLPGSLRASFEASAIQADGRLIAGGRIDLGEGSDFFLQRYNQDGTLDQSFGDGGTVTTDFSSMHSEIADLSILPGGKILAAGLSLDAFFNGRLAIARYNSDGTLDVTFGNNGTVSFSIDASDMSIRSMVVQPDQKIVLGGSLTGDFLMIRLNANGTIDTSFGENGFILTDFNGKLDLIGELILQCDGKIIAVGDAGGADITFQDIAVARYNTDGSLDDSFGQGGKTTIDIQSTEDAGRAVGIVDDGKIIIGGWTFRAGFYEFALVKLNADGTIHEDFGENGKVHTDFGPFDDIIWSLVIRDGKIIVGGSTSVTDRGLEQDVDFALARYDAAGSLDETFGSGGKVSTDFSAGTGLVSSDDIRDLSIDENNVFAVGASAFINGTIAAYQVEPLQECNNLQLGNITATPNELWPPNHKMVDVRVDYEINSTCLGCNSCVLSVTSNEEVSEDDWAIIDNHNVKLKAERSGKGTGRVYTIKITCSDLSGKQTVGNTTVKVPHNMSPKSKMQANVSTRKSKELVVIGSPNPSKNAFNLQVQTNSSLSYTLKITDVTGRVVEVRNGVTPFETITIGDTYKPGVYYAVVTQGQESRVIKLLKTK